MQKTLNILKKPLLSTLIAIIFGFIIAAFILTMTGYNPMQVFSALFKGVFSRPKNISMLIIKSTPIIITGIGVAFAFKTGLFNIGAEGQYIVGTIAATVTGISLNLHPVLQIPIVILSGVLAGGLFGGFVGWLKSKFGIHEVITSIMMNWIALNLCNFFVNTAKFHKPSSTLTYSINKAGFTTILYDWKTSKEGLKSLKQYNWLYDMLVKTDINIGIIVAIILAFGISFLLYKTTIGYELRAVGLNPDASQFAGINVKRNIFRSMLISGSICGLAGALTITGTFPHAISQLAMFEGNGFNGLAVALIAGSSPVGCIFSGLLFSGLIYGGQSVQSQTHAPSEIINIMIGIIVFFVALTKMIPFLADKYSKRSAAK